MEIQAILVNGKYELHLDATTYDEKKELQKFANDQDSVIGTVSFDPTWTYPTLNLQKVE